jgi:hypothetical protein
LRTILGFLAVIFSYGAIVAQGFEKTFSTIDMYSLIGIDSISPDIWKLNFLGYRGEWQALYYPEIDSLGTLKLTNLSSLDFIEVPLTKLSQTKQIRLQYYSTYALVDSYWVDLEDTTAIKRISHPYMAASFNWLVKEDSVFALFSTTSLESYVEKQIGSDSILLVNMDAKTGQFQVLDTFLLQTRILAPGTFIFNAAEQKVEYINDSLHYFFQRGKKQADTFFIDTGAYYDPALNYHVRDRAFWTNFFVMRNNLNGKYRIVRDTLNADQVKIEILANGGERLIYSIRFPHSLDASIPIPLPYSFYDKQQDSLIFSYAYPSKSGDTIHLYRVENDVITQRQVYKRSVNSDFEIREVHSFQDGSFLLSGRVNYYFNSIYGDSSADPHLIFIDKNGKTSRVSEASNFQVHLNGTKSHLKVFYQDSWTQLDYRIIDSSGRLMQAGDFIVFDGINLGDWGAGVYYLQLWNANSFLGQETCGGRSSVAILAQAVFAQLSPFREFH